MCDDQAVSHDHGAVGRLETAESGLSRRHFMHATAAVAVGAALLRKVPLRKVPRLPLRSPERAVTADGTSAYSMAMHIHSSFSEQSGSMDSQLFQAATNAVDVLWWTDHDHRMDGINYRDTVHFTSLTTEKGGPGQGGPWDWTTAESGSLATGSGRGIVETPCSPGDPVAGGSMQLTAQSTSTTLAKYGYFANCQPAAWDYRDNLTGQSLTIDVLLNPGWINGYLELLIGTSYHEASAGRLAGDYSLSYQFVPPGGLAGSVANGNQGVITIPVTPDSAQNPWGTVTITPSSDIAALWPDLDYRDFALWELTLSAASTGDLVEGYFDYLRFNRTISGQAFFDQQAAMEAVLAPKYPSVVQQQALEVSLYLPHLNWFGPNIVLPSYGATTTGTFSAFLQDTVVPAIHASGGLASYNHPYGYGDPKELAQSAQNALLAKVAAKLLPSGGNPAALGADLLEVGYRLRQGVDINYHIALWDVMSRNAVFLTGNGVSDDHFGTNWYGLYNNWVTWAWADSTGLTDLLAALAAGRSWCGSLSGFTGTLDMLVDGSVPMGAVSVSSLTSRQLVAVATGLPAGSKLQVLQGAVDYAGQSGLAANTAVIGSYLASIVTGGAITQTIDTAASSFLRTQVVSPAGVILATSNPVWLLQSPPPGGIPAPRQV